jgi:hypothetical protein
MDETMPRRKQPKTYSAQDARGAEIILRTRSERIIFIAGLVAAVVFGAVVAIVAMRPHG